MARSFPLKRALQAERSASVPSLTMHVVKGVWWNRRTGKASRRIWASTARKTRAVWTLTRSGVGVSSCGSRAQLDTFSMALNLRADSGRWRPMVDLISERMFRGGNEKLTHGSTAALGT
jgi:hypothetical protein